MSNSQTLLNEPDWVSPPGNTILNLLEERELNLEDFAQQLGRSKTVAQNLINGTHEIDNDLADDLTRVLGASKNFWMAREHDYRAGITKPKPVRVSDLNDLHSQLPVADMQKFGWIEKASSKNEQIKNCLEFFGVSSLAQWQGLYDNTFQSATYRRSSAYNLSEVATTAWLRKGEIVTSNYEVAEWSSKILKDKIPHFRRLTWYKNPVLFIEKLRNLLAEAGVKFAVVRPPTGCTASGAVRVLTDGTPHIQLSFRYKSDDQFWFSLFHEIGHLLLHYNMMPILEDSSEKKNEYEEEANQFASEIIIPSRFREEFLSLGGSRFPIINFAKKVGVAPGLIVGQLQYQKIIKFKQMQHLKRRYNWRG